MKKILIRIITIFTFIFFIFNVGLVKVVLASSKEEIIKSDISLLEDITLETFSSIDNASIYLREKMKERDTSVSFVINDIHLNNDLANSIYKRAIEHTGVPNEGDYIKGHLLSVAYSYTNYTSGEDIYTEVTFTFTFLSTKEMEEEVTLAVNEVINTFDLEGASDYTKVKTVYDYICDNVKYDWDHLETEVDQTPHSAYAAIINKKAVCQGYATLLYRMLLEVGIDNRYISGTSGEEGHAWNIIKLDDYYYNADSTWDRGLSVYYRYFLCTDYNFPDHTRDAEYLTAEFYEQYPMAEVPYGVKVEASGTLTSTMSWYLDLDGTLTITGSGKMPDFGNLKAPWYPYIESILKIEIGEGITTIGSYAFVRCNKATEVIFPSTLKEIHQYGLDNCRALKELNLPDGLYRIDDNAFSECVGLKEIILPDTVTIVGYSVFSTVSNVTYVKLSAGMGSIPDSMFFNMDSLTTVIIPEGITEIGDTAFRGSDGIVSITIPKQIKKIGVAAFADCLKLKNIYVDDENEYFTDVNGILFSKDMKTLISYPAARAQTSYTIPDGVTKLAYASFGSARNIYYVNFPDSLQVIDTYAFSWCNRLRSITIGPNVTSLGDSAFGWCYNLYSVTFLNPNTTFSWHTFTDCTSLEEIVLPEKLTAIPTGCFSDCTKLKTITFPSTLTSIGDSAFSYCNSLVKVDLPESVRTLGYDAFYKCEKLEIINFNGNIVSIGRDAFEACPSLKLINFEGYVSGVNSTAFNNTTVKSVYLDNQSFVNNITSKTGYGNMLANVDSFGIKTNITNIPSFIKSNFAFRTYIKYDGKYYVLYSNHECVWKTYDTTRQRCLLCKAVKDEHTHSYSTVITNPTCTTQGYTTYTCECSYTFKNNYTNALGHDYNISEILPTCTTTGLRTFTCTVCSHSYSDVIPMLSHLYESIVTLPTCEEEGYTTNTCKRCSNVVIDSYVSALGHTEVIDASVDATCTTTGLTEGKHCSVCNKILINQTIIPLLGHSYNTVVTNPTCLDEGYTTYTCKRCSDTYVSNYVSALGHSYESVITNPTCLDEGYTTHTCTRCEDSYIDSYKDALGHDLETHEKLDPTCTTDGYIEHVTCSRCDYTTYEVIDKLGHSYESVITKPTCLDEGYTTHTCTRCEDSYIDSYVDALGHDLETHEKLDPTCTTDGYIEHVTCSRCDYTTYEVIDKLGHSYESVITKPTCLDEGYTTHTCTRCEDSYIDSYVDALGHDLETHEKLDPTCTTDGYIEHVTCSRCDYTTYEVIDKLGHSYESVITKPTCLDEGYTTHTCIRCEDSYIDSYKEAHGHTYLDATYTWNETYTVCVAKRVCLHDAQHIETETTVATYKVVTPASCLNTGLGRYTTNSFKNNAFVVQTKDVIINALGHNLISHDAKDATCLEHGWEAYETCSRCDYSTYAKINALGHSYESIITSPTCTTDGYTTNTCTRCANSYIDSYVNALGHAYLEPTYTWNSTYSVCTAQRVCSNDLSHKETETVNATYKVITPSTCESSGVGRYTTNQFNNNSFVIQTKDVIINALGHEFINHEHKNPTCLEHGWEDYVTCTRCSYSTYKEISALGHSYESIIIDPTCLGIGYTTHTCVRCADSYTDSYVDALGHDYINPISNNNGTHKLTCKNDLNHVINVSCNFNPWKVTTPAGPFTEGEEIRDCQDCGYIEKRIIAATHVHEYSSSWTIDKVATCTENGSMSHHCTKDNCSSIIDETIIPLLGHDYESIVTNPTCTNEGYTTHTCKRCSDSYVDSYVDILGHTYLDPTYSWNETFTACTAIRVCKNDESHTETETVNATYKVITPSSCLSDGIGRYTTNNFKNSAFIVQTKDISISKLGHDLVSHDAKNATCTEHGFNEYVTCNRCDYTTYQEIEALGHNYIKTITYPTCTKEGFTTNTCDRCNDSYIDSYVEATGHNFSAVTYTWNTTYSTCTAVRVCLHDVQHIETETTVANYKIVYEPTCTKTGLVCYTTNEFVNKAFTVQTKEIAIDPLNHEFVTHDKKDPTCLEHGWDEYITCNRCDYSTYKELSPLGHEYGSWTIVKDPTEEEDGLKQKVCIRCNDVISEIIPKLSHTHKYTVNVVNPTCESGGYSLYTCLCGNTYKSDYKDPLGHDLETHEKLDPTCTASGYKEYVTCNRCNYSTFEELNALGHAYESVIIDATCISKGYTTHTCTRCNDSYIDNFVDQLDHDLETHEKLDPTCTTSGYKEYVTCNRCDYSTFEELNALGHDLKTHEKLDPTCTASGHKEYVTCNRCNYSTFEELKALDHDLETHEKLDPTCTASGYKEYVTCNRCDYSTFEELKALGHDLETYEKLDPTCTTSGYKEYVTCSRCNFSTFEELKALGHDYESVIVDATCTKEGYTLHTCNRCNDSYTDSYIPKLNHTESDWIIDSNASYETEGKKHIECTKCGEVLKEQLIPKLEKPFNPIIIIVPSVFGILGIIATLVVFLLRKKKKSL